MERENTASCLAIGASQKRKIAYQTQVTGSTAVRCVVTYVYPQVSRVFHTVETTNKWMVHCRASYDLRCVFFIGSDRVEDVARPTWSRLYSLGISGGKKSIYK